jgi:hypothetical protein
MARFCLLIPIVRTKLLQVSAATIDRALGKSRSGIEGQRRRCTGDHVLSVHRDPKHDVVCMASLINAA